MTRKRFVKLLMARGFSRNVAVFIADWVVGEGYCYKTAYKALSIGVLYG